MNSKIFNLNLYKKEKRLRASSFIITSTNQKMQKIVLLSCVSKKLDKESSAELIYNSPLFKKSLNYAKSLNPDKIYILSAKHYVLELNDVIQPYDETLNTMSNKDILKWSNNCLNQLKQKQNLEIDNFIILAGDKYRKYLLPYIKNYELPLEGLRIGEQMSWYDKQLKTTI